MQQMQPPAPSTAIIRAPENTVELPQRMQISVKVEGVNDWSVERVLGRGVLNANQIDFPFELMDQSDEQYGSSAQIPDHIVKEIGKQFLIAYQFDSIPPKYFDELVAGIREHWNSSDLISDFLTPFFSRIAGGPDCKEQMRGELAYALGRPDLANDQLEEMIIARSCKAYVPDPRLSADGEVRIRSQVAKVSDFFSSHFIPPEQLELVIFPRGLFTPGTDAIAPTGQMQLYDRPVRRQAGEFGSLYEFLNPEKHDVLIAHEYMHIVGFGPLTQSVPLLRKLFVGRSALVATRGMALSEWGEAHDIVRKKWSEIFERVQELALPHIELLGDLGACVYANDGKAISSLLSVSKDNDGARDYSLPMPRRRWHAQVEHDQMTPAGRAIWNCVLGPAATKEERVERLAKVAELIAWEIAAIDCLETPPAVHAKNIRMIRSVKDKFPQLDWSYLTRNSVAV